MPRIYELPASAGVENRSLEIRHTPSTIPGSARQQPQRPQGSADPRRMLANQMDMELNNVTRQFDVNVSALDQGQLEPDKYKAEYAKLQRQAMNQRVAIQAKHEAAAQQIKNMQKLVEDRIMEPEQMQATMLVMAGVPSEHVRRAFTQTQRQKPTTVLRDIKYERDRIIAWQEQFDDYRGPHFWRGKEREKLYYRPATGPRRKAKEAETEVYDASKLKLIELSRKQQEIFSTLTPLEQDAQRGSQAAQRFGMGRAPMPTGRWGSVQVPEPTPKKKQKPIRQRNKRTGEERISYDGGKTWQMIG